MLTVITGHFTYTVKFYFHQNYPEIVSFASGRKLEAVHGNFYCHADESTDSEFTLNAKNSGPTMMQLAN